MSRTDTKYDLTGLRVGRLVIVGREYTAPGVRHWKCQCDCGNVRFNSTTVLRKGTVKSCGCYSREAVSARQRRHGHARDAAQSPTYGSHRAMLARCHNPRTKAYAAYGAKGVAVCERWRGEGGFIRFLADVGERTPGTTLHRIDNSKGYEPGNVRWATPAEQSHESRCAKLTHDLVNELRGRYEHGESLASLARRFAIHRHTAKAVVKRWTWTDAP